jgi:phosphoribosylglycinamide formyltransferase-1
MQALARACLEGRVNAEVAVVLSEREDAGGLAIARELDLQAEVVRWTSAAERAAFEKALTDRLEAHRVEIIALAGFMRILSPQFVSQYEGRIINIHPALLPLYRGLHTHSRVLAAGDAKHGASVHFVTAELDGGPVILQSRLDVRPGESEKDLAARVLATEHVIYPRVVGWLADGRLTWRDGKPWLDGTPLDAPLVEDFE